MTCQETKSHHIKRLDVTWHYITSHDMTCPKSNHLIFPQVTCNLPFQPHYFISPRNRSHDIKTHHIPAHDISATERLEVEHHMAWRVAALATLPFLTSPVTNRFNRATSFHPATDIMNAKHITSQHMKLPPWNGWRLSITWHDVSQL